MYGSQSFHIIFGNIGRYALLIVGFMCVLIAVFRRSGLRWIQRNFLFIFLSSIYLIVLLTLSFAREHDIFNARNMVFIGICYGMFIAGYLLAREPTRDGEWSDSITMMFCVGSCILASYGFLEYVKIISFIEVRRDLGISELHPVGVAYASMILFIVYLYMIVTTKRVISKPLYTIAIGMTILIIITTESRGAVLSGILSLCIVVYILFANKLLKVNAKIFFTVVSAFLLGSPIAVYLFRNNYVLSEKLDALFFRFQTLFESFAGESGIDLSSDLRMNIYDYYFSNPELWIFFGEKYYYFYPHNQWLEILVRFGLLGLPLLGFSLYIMGKSLSKAFSGKYEMSSEWYLIMFIFLFSYIQSMTNANLEINRTLWLGFGYLFGYQYHLKGFLGQHRLDPVHSHRVYHY